jgi:hypothetical protein
MQHLSNCIVTIYKQTFFAANSHYTYRRIGKAMFARASKSL